MSSHRGQDGALYLGGRVNSALLKGAIASAATTATLDAGAAAIEGVIVVGDQFVIAADGITRTATGGPFYTPTNASTTNSIADVTFTPAATAGAADNAAVVFTNNSVSEIRDWQMTVEQEVIDDTVKSDTHRTFKGGLVKWSGTAKAYLDYDDTEQAALIDEIATGTPDGTLACILFSAQSDADEFKSLYGAAELSQFRVMSNEGSGVVEVEFSFQGTGTPYIAWT